MRVKQFLLNELEFQAMNTIDAQQRANPTAYDLLTIVRIPASTMRDQVFLPDAGGPYPRNPGILDAPPAPSATRFAQVWNIP
jgi:hypothetical protein